MNTILIHGGAVLTEDGWVEPGYVLIQDALIVTVAAGEPVQALVDQVDELISAEHCAVMPGLLNAHTHLSQTFMRGLAGGRALLPWLKERIWPLQAALTVEDVRLAARLGLVENLRGGVTHVVNHHKVASTPAHTDAVCAEAVASGLRVTLARAWSDLGTNAESAEMILSDLNRLFEQWQGHSHLKIANGPLALWRCSAETLQQSHQLAQQYGSFTHCHVAESQDEVQLSLEQRGVRPVAWLAQIGVLDADTQVVHAVWLDAAEIEQLAQAAAPVIHCPVSNAVLGSGIAPLATLMQHGITIKLATDGPASNDTQDMWETLKAAIHFARASTLNATVLPPKQALGLALSRDALRGGDSADLIIVNLNHPRAMPVHDIASALTLSTHGSDVQTVIVAGKILLRDAQLVGLDEATLLAECREVITNLRQRAQICSNTGKS